jgi:transcriptional regulator with XRE-family HTH domain
MTKRPANNPPDPIDIAVGARIRLRRRQLDLSQTQLANALGGITYQQLQKYERGVNRVSASMLVNIAAKLETTVAALVGEDGSAQVEPVILAQIAEPYAAELLAAYAREVSGEVRRAMLSVAQAMAANGDKARKTANKGAV